MISNYLLKCNCNLKNIWEFNDETLRDYFPNNKKYSLPKFY